MSDTLVATLVVGSAVIMIIGMFVGLNVLAKKTVDQDA
jgi:uncharacterized membrane protein